MGNGSATTAQQRRARYARTSGTGTATRTRSKSTKSANTTTAALAPSGTTYAPLTQAATPEQQRAVREVAREWAGHGRWQRERGAVIDAQGAHVLDGLRSTRRTVRGQVVEEIQLTPAQRAQMRGADRPEFVHTHPGRGGSFSPADIAFVMGNRAAAIHAIGRGPDGRVWQYTLRPGPKAGAHGLWSRQTYEKLHVGGALQRLDKAVYAHQSARVARGRLTPAQAESSHWHEVMLRLQRELGPDVLRYEAGPLSPSD